MLDLAVILAQAAPKVPHDRSVAALLIAGVVVAVVVLIAATVPAGAPVYVVTAGGTYTPPKTGDETPAPRTVLRGDVIPADHVSALKGTTVETSGPKRLRLLRGLVMGADNRLSTSKTVACAWTFAIFFGLLALLVARWAGDPTGWKALTDKGLQEEYLLLLGGPYAAAVIAKYQASNDETKTTAPPGTGSAKDLVANDAGQTDLGDFQYVLFNSLALLWYLGELIPHLRAGMPDLPPLLTGLALTSAGGYSAKKLVGQMVPRLTSVVPPAVKRIDATTIPTVDVYGNNLIVSSAGGSDELDPTVIVGTLKATVSKVTRTGGADRLEVTLPPTVADNTPLLIAVVRADGVPAQGPGGAQGVTVTVSPP